MSARAVDTSLAMAEGAGATVLLDASDSLRGSTVWACRKWEQDKIDHATHRLARADMRVVAHHVGGRVIYKPLDQGVPSDLLEQLGIVPDFEEERHGNLMLNEGLQRLRDLLVGAGGTAFNNANAFIGVGDTSTAEAATQTELQATQNAANRFYKGMNATFPTTAGQAASWAADFTSGEANFTWNEWSISAGATTASASGFLVGTTNLNRKVQNLGTKTLGTWTLTGTVTFS